MAHELADKLTELHPFGFWALVLVVVAFAAAGFYAAFRFLRRARLIVDTPTSAIRSAAQGYLELEGYGELMAGEPIIAPLTGTRCTWYRYKVERREVHHSNGKRRESWRTVSSGVSDNLFFLVDDTGQCVIDPEGAEVTCSNRDHWYGHSQRPTSGPPSASPLRMASGNYRYTEERMHPGEPLYAMGLFKTTGGAGDLGSTREEVQALLREWKRDREGLVRRFDANGDGTVDLNEWEVARKAARREVLAARSEQLARAGTNLMIRPTDKRRPYLLSVLPQDHLARRFRWLAAAGLALFFLAGSAASWMVSVRVAA